MDNVNYPELLKGFYELRISNALGVSGGRLALALLHIANRLHFPSRFAASNKELCNMTEFSDETLIRVRKNYLLRCIMNDKYIFSYYTGTTRQCGIYKIEYRLFRMDMNEAICKLGYYPQNMDNIVSKTPTDYPQNDNNVTTNGKSNDTTHSHVPIKKRVANKPNVHKDIQDINTNKEKRTDYPQNMDIHNKQTNVQYLERDNLIKLGTSSSQENKIINSDKQEPDDITKIQYAIRTKYKGIITTFGFPAIGVVNALLKEHKDNGGFEYVLRKIDEMPLSIPENQIWQTVNGYCNHPEKGKALKKKDAHPYSITESFLQMQKQYGLDEALCWLKDTLESPYFYDKVYDKELHALFEANPGYYDRVPALKEVIGSKLIK